MAAVTICCDFRAQEEESCFHIFPSICHEMMGLDAIEYLVLSWRFHCPLSPSSRGSLIPLCFLPLEWYLVIMFYYLKRYKSHYWNRILWKVRLDRFLSPRKAQFLLTVMNWVAERWQKKFSGRLGRLFLIKLSLVTEEKPHDLATFSRGTACKILEYFGGLTVPCCF